MVSELLSSFEGRGGDVAVAPLTTYTGKFNELFPLYLSMGMSEEQYWDRDSQLVVAYRKAEEIRIEKKNQEMWLQGAYVYDAFCRVAPVLHAFTKKGAKPIPYLEEPYALNEKQVETIEEKKAKATFTKGKQIMEGFMAQHNKKYERKEEGCLSQ